MTFYEKLGSTTIYLKIILHQIKFSSMLLAHLRAVINIFFQIIQRSNGKNDAQIRLEVFGFPQRQENNPPKVIWSYLAVRVCCFSCVS